MGLDIFLNFARRVEGAMSAGSNPGPAHSPPPFRDCAVSR